MLFVNLFPYWSGSDIDSAAADLAEAVARLKAKAGGKEVLISETGWPTAGQTIQNPGDSGSAAVPSGENAARYFEEVRAWSLETGTPVLWFSFTDEPYKAEVEGACGAHWGLLEADLTLKPCYEMTEFFLRKRFTDVRPGAYYAQAVYWAIRNRITSGSSPSTFSPHNPCTREQVVTFIWATFGKEAPPSLENPFQDVYDGAWFMLPVLWARSRNITAGVTPDCFGVGSSCTRAQVVTFLWAAAGKPDPIRTDCPFTDVSENDYFYRAVLWAAENRVTSGMTPDTFGPASTCTRAQVA